MSYPPRFELFPLRCKKCGTDWEAWQPQNVPVKTWLAHVETHRCPKCRAGFKHVLIRLKPEPPAEEK